MTIKTFAATGVITAAMVITSGTALACNTAPKPVVQHQTSKTNCNHVIKPTPAPKTNCNHPVVTPTPKPTTTPKPDCDHKVTPTPTLGKGSTPQTPAATPVATPAPVARPTTLPQTGGTGDLSALLGLPTLAVTGSAYLRSRKAK